VVLRRPGCRGAPLVDDRGGARRQGRALRDQAHDVLVALTRDEQQVGPVLADLGVDEPGVLRAIERRRPPVAPEQPWAEG
jgi:hypothetical protein